MPNLKNIFLLSIVFCFVLTSVQVSADIATPGRSRRLIEREKWTAEFPDLRPILSFSLDEKGTILTIQIQCKAPTDYSMTLHMGPTYGKILVGDAVKAKIRDLDGGVVRTEKIILPGEDTRFIISLYYTLYGVKQTRFGLKRTDKSINGCILRPFQIMYAKGSAYTKEFSPAPPFYMHARMCD